METKNAIEGLAKELIKLTFIELVTRITDEVTAIAFLEAVRWPVGPYCFRCGCADVSRVETNRNRPILYCTACKTQFSVTTGTIMEDTKIELRKWLLGIHLMCSSKKGISSLQLHRMLSVAKRTAWHLSHRIRFAMGGNAVPMLSGIVEADECYIGGKVHGKGRGFKGNKTAIVTVVERNGNAITHVMHKPEVNRADVTRILTAHVEPTAALNTDESALYGTIGKAFASHDTVNHSKDEYVRLDRKSGRVATTNAAEGFFGNFDRQLNGTHHHVSGKHLCRYATEFDFKYNSRKVTDGVRTLSAIRSIEGKRLTLYRAVSVKAPCLIDRVLGR